MASPLIIFFFVYLCIFFFPLDPGPTDLIIKFLANSSINVNGVEQTSNTANNQHNSGFIFGNGAEDQSLDGELGKSKICLY